jgi:hypothetical protein
VSKQAALSTLGIIVGIVLAIDDVKLGSYLWAGFWFVMIVLHFWILVGEIAPSGAKENLV